MACGRGVEEVEGGYIFWSRGVIVGSALSGKAPQGFIGIALGIVLIASGIVTIQKGSPTVWPIAAGVAALLLGSVLYAPHYMNKRHRRELERKRGTLASDALAEV